MSSKVVIATTEKIPGYDVSEVLGVVSAPVAMARWFGADLIAGFKDLIGGRVGRYEELMRNATNEALERLKVEASKLGADAVIGVKMFSPEIGGHHNIGEVVVYGTAVRLTKV
ncbi:MAG: YbjQ family protein [Candidatus Bathyarchaeia archaeon]